MTVQARFIPFPTLNHQSIDLLISQIRLSLLISQLCGCGAEKRWVGCALSLTRLALLGPVLGEAAPGRVGRSWVSNTPLSEQKLRVGFHGKRLFGKKPATAMRTLFLGTDLPPKLIKVPHRWLKNAGLRSAMWTGIEPLTFFFSFSFLVTESSVLCLKQQSKGRECMWVYSNAAGIRGRRG